MSKRDEKARIREHSDGVGATTAEGNVIKDVKILGLTSKNKRRYLESAIKEAVPLYEGAPVYIDHGDKPASEKTRPFADKFGSFHNVRFVEGDGLRGDFKFNPRHPQAETFLGWVESDPGAVGFSSDALCNRRFESDGTTVVYGISKVYSIDLVSAPATTQGLFESIQPERYAMDNSGMPGEVQETSDGVDGLTQKISELCAHLAADGSMDGKAKLKKMKAALKILEADEPPAKEEKVKEDANCDDMEKAEESVKASGDPHAIAILNKLNLYRATEAQDKADRHARQMCLDARLPEAVAESLVDVLVGLKDDAARTRLIETFQKNRGTLKPPTSAAPTPVGKQKLTVDDILMPARK